MTEDLSPALDLCEQLLVLLRERPEGLSEYELIQALKRRHSTHIPNLPLTDKLVLFRSHFLVFNALYRLRDRLREAASAHLAISPMAIRLLPYGAGEAALAERDPLRDYYLDLDNLRDTDEADVERLLASFWTRMQGGDEKQAALELFELDRSSEPVTAVLVKQRYRQLVGLHHPDRGGSTERLQSINLALEILQRYYH
ncbi:DNA-J related domain-containing protein [Pseudomonas oligotrophica]|uniref:DNA-J related domain-containing protein n=1 Tax=Pseudomonas oligotrophica TaxID=2912055 RepID=UPI001F1BBD87|nr:DNA-J related domain-containing protein [Pseudomonas oligotrophica]MCF7202145.1 molecular chaperone DnaJ [Pseudomonas oligotrophica]